MWVFLTRFLIILYYKIHCLATAMVWNNKSEFGSLVFMPLMSYVPTHDYGTGKPARCNSVCWEGQIMFRYASSTVKWFSEKVGS